MEKVISLGLDDTPENWKKVEIIARQIEILDFSMWMDLPTLPAYTVPLNQ